MRLMQFLKEKNRWIILLAAVLVLAAGGGVLLSRSGKGGASQGNLLQNGDFSQVDAENFPLYWTADAYDGLNGSQFEVAQEEDGPAAHIVNRALKDARFAQTVAVSPGATYRLHGFIRASASGGMGANLSVAGVAVYSELVYDSQGEWQEVTLYGVTRESQSTVTVYARLGGYSGEAVGEAYFRDVTLTRVDSVPLGYYAYNWYIASADGADTGNSAGTSNASLLLAGCGALYLVFFVFLCRFLRRRASASGTPDEDAGGYALLAAVLAAGLGLRLFLAAHVAGYDVDIGCFTSWANSLGQGGPIGFYQYLEAEGRWNCDYPPGYLWILWLIGGIGRLMQTGGTELMVKLPPILADLALCVVLYRECRKRLSVPASLAAAALYAFNPLILITGAAWGQADAIMTLLLILVVVHALRNQWKFALPLYMLAVLFKPQALMFGPLGLAALILSIIQSSGEAQDRQRRTKDVLIGLGLTLGTALIVTLPFAIGQAPAFLLDLYSKTMGQYAYATVNCCNLYFLLGKNWAFADSSLGGALWWIPALAYLLAALPLLFAAVTRAPVFRGRPGGRQDRLRLYVLGGLAALLGAALVILGVCGGLTYASLGAALIAYAVALFIALYVLGHDPGNLPVFGAGMLILLCCTGSMMHERYAYPALALLLLGYALKKDVRILWLMVGVSIAAFLNVGCVLDRNIRIGGFAGSPDSPLYGIASDTAILEYVSAGMNCILCCWALALCSLLSRGGTAVEFAPAVRRRLPLPREGALPQMTGRDWVILGAVTALYSVLAFTNLGSTKAPQNAFVAPVAERQIVMDLSESQDFQLCYYIGYHRQDSEVTIETSEDGETWQTAFVQQYPKDQTYCWITLPDGPDAPGASQAFSGRYVRFTADQEILSMFDVTFQSPADGSQIAATRVGDQVNDEKIILDLGDTETFHMLYYGGIHDYDSPFTVELSDDGEHWNQYVTAPMNIGDCFKWQYISYYSGGQPMDLTARYLRLTPARTGMTLFEVLFRDAETGETLPVTLISDSRGNETAACLIDEQDTLEGEPGWYNSTYFDEIYHARTAYEHLHGMQPYECSHPPLGKVLMSWCVAIFGMTPFGWRFAGALAGVLMLPGMYLLGRLLFRKKWGGIAASGLMALDLMHFTQTRIATIDSFAVLFIIWMIYFMLRWFYQDFFRMKFWKTLIPLALSGLCMGLAVASKWTGCYGGVALAILFFLGIWRRYRLVRRARRIKWRRVRITRRKLHTYRLAHASRPMPAARRCWQGTAARHGARRLLITVASCLVFFVAVPALIYCLSYIPYFAYNGGVTIQKIIDAANYMLWYHSQPGLGMDHPYYSPWYQWPVIFKPMFYFSSSYEPAGYQSAINALGNPAVWWLGLAGLLGVCILAVRRHIQRDRTLSLAAERDDSRFAVLLICFFVQYLPWVLVPRGTYIYHYFPCVPIIILCGLLCLDRLGARHEKAARNAVIVWIALAAICFLILYPFASGTLTPQGWMDAVRKVFPRIYY